MAFAFSQRSGVQAQVVAIALEQSDGALQACRGEGDFDKTVHGLRRRCKKIRGLLRLIGPGLEGASKHDRAVRAAAHGLAGTRDAAVMIETLADLLRLDRDGQHHGRIDSGAAQALTETLQRRATDRAAALSNQELLAAFAARMEQVGARVRTWRIGSHGFAALGGGLELTYRRMSEGMHAAMRQPTAVALHEWRKHTKYHWHHVGLLSRAAPDLLAGRQTLLDALGEALGDHHNLHVLGQFIATPGQTDAAVAGAIQAVIGERQSELAARAFALGRQLAAEKPGALRRRFRHYWQLLPAKD